MGTAAGVSVEVGQKRTWDGQSPWDMVRKFVLSKENGNLKRFMYKGVDREVVSGGVI